MILKACVLVIGLAGVVLSASIDCNIEQCAKPTKFYEELGCKAVFGAKSCCAKRFECPDFKNLDDNKCTFDGKEYNIGEILPRGSADTAKCIETCFCTREDNGPAKFTCSKNDCGVSSFKVPGCINIYGDLNECCSTSVVCDDEEKESLASCFVGKEYREGEKFIPETNPCYECLCHKDFDNTTIADNPHCRKLNCEIDLRYKSFVQRGCLPVFTSENCCPVDWECPKADKKVVKRSADEDESTHAPRQEVFIVTPSKNMQEYLDIVKLNNAASGEEQSAVVTEALKETTTLAVPAPTLSSDPFQAPNTESSVSVIVKVDEPTTPLVKAAVDFTAGPVDVTPASESRTPVMTAGPIDVTSASDVTLPPTTSASSPSLESTAAATSPSTTQEATSESTTTTTVAESTTAATRTAKKNSSEESKESDEEEDENKNLFGEEVDDDEILPTKMFETTTEEISESSVSTTESTTSAPSTTEATKEEPVKVLSPEEPITVVQSSTPLPATTAAEESTTLKAPVTEIFIVTESSTTTTTASSTEQSLFAKAAETIYDLFPQVSIVKTPEPKSLESPESVPQVVVVTGAQSSVAPEATTTQASTTVPTISENVAPTAFAELLTTLKDIVAKIESTAPTTDAPKSVTTSEPLPELPAPLAQPVGAIFQELNKPLVDLPEAPLAESAQVEFVNFTVSTHNDGPKVISKRSAPDADLIPQYFKQHYSISKDKGCVFNSKTYKLGEVIKTSNECLKCICEYAPIGHCMLKEKCNF